MATRQCYYCNTPVTPSARFCPQCNSPLVLHDRYQLVRVLGKGGFGVVYEAIHTRIGRRCAIKVVASTSIHEQQRIEAEAGILGRYAPQFPFIPDIYDVWSQQNQTFLVMEYVDGPTLDQTALPWPPAQVEDFLRILLGYLAQVHAIGLIHRDLKPQNLKQTPDGRYVMLDFGIAKEGVVTQTAAKMATPDYAPPEQMKREPTDARSDLYSLAATAYRLLTGHLPVRAAVRLQTGAAPQPPGQLVPGVRPALERALLWMLELNRDNRPSDAQAVLALLDAQPQRTSTSPPSTTPALAPTASQGAPVARVARLLRVPWGIWLAVGVPLTCIVACVITITNFGQRPASPTTATARPIIQAAPTVVPTAQVVVPTAQIEPTLIPTDEPTTVAPALTSDTPPSPTPEPTATNVVLNEIAFVSDRDGNDEIYTMNSDGTSQVNLTNNPASDTHPVWSPDGSKIAFVSDRDGNEDIYVSDGSSLVNLTNNLASDNLPVWSPDGTKIAFVSNRDGDDDIYVMKRDGSDQIPLVSKSGYFNKFNSISWSRDSSSIAFGSIRDVSDGEIYVVSADGSHQLIRLTNNSAHEEFAAWSPTSNEIVYVRDGGLSLYIINEDRSQRLLTSNWPSFFAPRWSPDGKRVAVLSDHDGTLRIYTMNTDGSEQPLLPFLINSHKLMGDYFFEFFAWSPDSRELAIVSEHDGNPEIYVMNADGSGAKTRLTNNRAEDSSPAWSPK